MSKNTSNPSGAGIPTIVSRADLIERIERELEGDDDCDGQVLDFRGNVIAKGGELTWVEDDGKVFLINDFGDTVAEFKSLAELGYELEVLGLDEHAR